ncbi:serine protease inhibitor Cvsi-2-like [Mercenaria mercenaria]|uniref:serine protease inhibitor Cvsi-2-like n=1 Tax=Mercenaria mercenaria TaxID=6596 RepID=UPI00234EDEA4|nr:serine protease inhibitor Cvsi-2-like [Mercenaria mercenaria]
MRIAVYFVLFCTGYAAGESCLSLPECTNTLCKNGFEMHCVDAICTCLSPSTGFSCTTKYECFGNPLHVSCNKDGTNWHCVDSRCRCY